MRTRGKVKVLKHHRTSDVYLSGRYLHADMKISMKSKRGREIARETAAAILNAVGASEAVRDVTNKLADNATMIGTSGSVAGDES